MLTKCPHCGYPLQDAVNIRKKPQRAKRGHKRLPNGFGQITKLTNSRLRKPFRAMVTVGKNESGKPICKLLKPTVYFATYNEAYEALLNHSKYPQTRQESITFEELYKRWFAEVSVDGRSGSSIRDITSSWAYCTPLYKMQTSDIRVRHIRDCLLNASASAGVKRRMKQTLNIMFDYAVEYEYADKNYSRELKLPKNIALEANVPHYKHMSFTNDEMEILWKNENNPIVSMILIQCYSGWRPGELTELESKNISTTEWYIIGGKKTAAGKDRIVPIHTKIRHLVDRWMRNKTELLFGMNYMKYLNSFHDTIEQLGLNPEHKPHDPRKQFVTMAKRNNMDEYALKRIVGHVIQDVTENVYTDRDLEWLRSELEKV